MSARRWLFSLFTLLLLLILGSIGWEQYQLIQRQAAAPVVSVAEDGTVRINGQVIEMTPDGLPPTMLEKMEGAPPVELPAVREQLDATEDTPYRCTLIMRAWRYARLGLTLHMGRFPLGKTRPEFIYRPWLECRVDDPATVELRGQRWWVGPHSTLSPGPQRLDVLQLFRAGDELPYRPRSPVKFRWGDPAHGRDTEVSVVFGVDARESGPGGWLPVPSAWLPSPGPWNPPIDTVYINLPAAPVRVPSTWPAEYGECVVETVTVTRAAPAGMRPETPAAPEPAPATLLPPVKCE